jgi:hypothetical protein
MQHLGMGQCRDTHLKSDAGDAAKSFMDVENLIGDGFGVTDNQGSGRTTRGIELCPRGGRPSR